MRKSKRNESFSRNIQLIRENPDQISTLNRPLNPSEAEALSQSFPTKKRIGTESFRSGFYQIFKEELLTVLLKLFHN